MSRLVSAAVAVATCFAALPAPAAEPAALIAKSRKMTPQPPWPAGDERGMANTLGAGTMARCAWHLSQPASKTYELSYVRSGTMPLSGFSGPYVTKPKSSAGIPGTSQLFNMESLGEGAEPGQQGTQIDALGHFGYMPQAWDGKAALPTEGARYYGGFTQKDVKPTPDSPLQKLGIEKAPPIVTTAILLDAKTHLGKGKPMEAGALVTADRERGATLRRLPRVVIGSRGPR